MSKKIVRVFENLQNFEELPENFYDKKKEVDFFKRK